MTMAIDFGTCNTVLARWNAATRRVDTLRLEEIGKTYRYRAPGAANGGACGACGGQLSRTAGR